MTRQTMTDIIYDTLMENKQHPQFNIDNVDNNCTMAAKGIISFSYGDTDYLIRVTRVGKTDCKPIV